MTVSNRKPFCFHWVTEGIPADFPFHSGTVSVRGFAEIFQLGPQLRGSAACRPCQLIQNRLHQFQQDLCVGTRLCTYLKNPQKLGPNDFETRPVLVQKRGLLVTCGPQSHGVIDSWCVYLRLRPCLSHYKIRSLATRHRCVPYIIHGPKLQAHAVFAIVFIRTWHLPRVCAIFGPSGLCLKCCRNKTQPVSHAANVPWKKRSDMKFGKRKIWCIEQSP